MPVNLSIDNYDLAGFAPRVTGFGAGRFGFVVTPNVDHVIRFHDDAGFRSLYQAAEFVLLDSRVLALMLRLGRGLRVRVCPGSDLTAALFREFVRADDRVVLIGATAAQAQRLTADYGLRDLRHYCPPMGFIRDPAAVEACLQFVEHASPFRYCLIAIGSPQQEVVAARLKERGRARGLALCIGASINFLTGVERRAPRWLQRAHLEWLFRLLSEPGRMARRYLVRGPRMFWLLRHIEVSVREPARAVDVPPS
ncbi:MAG: WecB/TagA/CpsF family glycosyltransferase [Gammaproteobacteria bacterium]|nr:WecB/TagA/CpsF family glycosyltransferase [Gammaproteobacteria bacterium]